MQFKKKNTVFVS